MKKCSKLRELFEITKVAKKFDKRSGTFNIAISYKTAPYKITSRTLAVAEAFGIGLDQQQRQIIYDNIQLRISPIDIVYIIGESGSGKTVLLQRLEKLLSPNTANIKGIHVEKRKPIIDTVGKNVEEALELLSRVGLNDAFLFLRSYSELSDGQKYRYKIAKLIETRKQYWIMDEFGSTLDRDTAKIVAFNVQKLARQTGQLF
jgi:ABC-type ATPase with predicted acetyltransferase domain